MRRRNERLGRLARALHVPRRLPVAPAHAHDRLRLTSGHLRPSRLRVVPARLLLDARRHHQAPERRPVLLRAVRARHLRCRRWLYCMHSVPPGHLCSGLWALRLHGVRPAGGGPERADDGGGGSLRSAPVRRLLAGHSELHGVRPWRVPRLRRASDVHRVPRGARLPQPERDVADALLAWLAFRSAGPRYLHTLHGSYDKPSRRLGLRSMQQLCVPSHDRQRVRTRLRPEQILGGPRVHRLPPGRVQPGPQQFPHLFLCSSASADCGTDGRTTCAA